MNISPFRSTPLVPDKTEAAFDTRPGFKDSLAESIKSVNELQIKAHEAMSELATGKTNNIHETMIAIQKAEISFKMLTQVRNKIMAAYQEIMRMQV